MSSRRPRLTVGLIKDIAQRVQLGAFPHVAAEAAGVPAELFHQWMEWGSGPAARQPYRDLAERVRHAHGFARCNAEIHLCRTDPKAWLLNGPGKDSDSLPGWTTPIKGDAKSNAADVLPESQMQALVASLLEALAPYPEARAALAAALEGGYAASGVKSGSPPAPNPSCPAP
jgi:hypothetical protein